MWKMFINILVSVSLLVSCSDIDAINNDIKAYRQRLEKLEDVIESVNSNTMALSAVFDEKILIVSYEERKNSSGEVCGYRIGFSDGSVSDVTFGDRADALVPVIGVDDDGNFVCSFDSGETFSPIEGAAGANVKDGVSPVVDVNDEGYWVVSLDGGKTWSLMRDANNLPVHTAKVNAVHGNTFFDNIVFDGEKGVMVFTLKSGKTLEVIVRDTMLFSIAHYTDGDEIRLGEELKYLVDHEHVASAFFTVPDGWRAVLDDNSMNVFAPESAAAGEYGVALTLVGENGLLQTRTFVFNLIAEPATPKWRLDYEDEFDKGCLDADSWTVVKRANTTALRYMSDDPRCYDFRENSLALKAIKNDNLAKDPVPYLTGGIYTKHLKEFKAGRLEIRARMNCVQGTQPAIWTGSWEGITWPWGGEVDIMEHYNVADHIYQTVHSHYTYDLGFDKEPKPQVKVPLDPEEWHVYGVELHEDELIFLVDGEKTLSYPRIETTEEGQFPFYSSSYLFLDMQIIGDWGGKVDDENLSSAELEIDWVRHYLWK